jgi:capsule polysaccharide export protein KpsC/LpsZ
MSEFNEDQAALIRNLSKCLKQNQILAVKEHPQQLGKLWTSEYKKLKASLSNVIVISGEIASDYAIQNSKLVIVQTGTLGWEAIIRGKPVVILGYTFYDKYPYINKFVSFENLREMIRNETYLLPEKEATIRYIAQIWGYSYKGNPFPHQKLCTQENLDNIVYAIEDFLSKYKARKISQ